MTTSNTDRQDQSDLTDNTVEADRQDATTQGHADRPPTPEEEAAAPTSLDPEAAKAYKEAIERGANVPGEGQID
jgi:hypothetical protein